MYFKILFQTEIFTFKVLRDQGLGKYCDVDFVRAASREMQEAMDMTAEEFDAAAYKLLTAERQGTLCLPVGTESSGWAGEDESADESVPLRMDALPGGILQPQSKKKKSSGPNGR